MFNWKHYVPILKWKRAEMLALAKLRPEQKQLMTPFIQILMPPPKVSEDGAKERSPKELLNESIALFRKKVPGISEEIIKHWGKAPIFVDMSLIHAPLRKEACLAVIQRGNEMDALLIPAIRLHDEASDQATAVTLAKMNNRGLCLRISRTEFTRDGELASKLGKFLDHHALTEESIDLMIDYQEELCTDIAILAQRLPNITRWRTFTVACGSFPVDLTECKLGLNFQDRLEWLNWLSQKHAGKLQRVPSFGDYTIQHPIYKESVRFFSPSASIRYTLHDKWLIMRGQKGKSEQYRPNAQLLSERNEFLGRDFSYGDEYIADMGKVLKGKPGSAATWLIAGINHHLACTAFQIANLT